MSDLLFPMPDEPDHSPDAGEMVREVVERCGATCPCGGSCWWTRPDHRMLHICGACCTGRPDTAPGWVRPNWPERQAVQATRAIRPQEATA